MTVTVTMKKEKGNRINMDKPSKYTNEKPTRICEHNILCIYVYFVQKV